MKEGVARISEPARDSAAIPVWKRALDFACIFAAIPVLAPLMVLIAIAIQLVSPGPVLFKQNRIGYLGRPFRCLKFRTMRVDAQAETHQTYLKDLIQSEVPMTKMDLIGDSRLFPLASAFRATGLDELPQVFNVLRGEMSLVGPRPCLPYEYENYSAVQKRRFDTLPGITGLWQVSGKNRTTFDEMIQLDIDYARSKTLRLDLLIIARTIPALIVQMWDTRVKRKQNLRPVRSEPIIRGARSTGDFQR